MEVGISYHLKQISLEILKVLRWVQASNRFFDLHQFPNVLADLEGYLKRIYSQGGDSLEPGGLCALTTLQESVASGSIVKSQQVCDSLIECTLKCFVEKWRGPLLVTLNVEICRSHLKKVSEMTDKSETLKTCKKILDTVKFIVSVSNRQDHAKTSTILLCLNQIKSCLPLFVTGFEQECSLVQKYASNCLMECLDRIQQESCETTVLSCSEFIDLMDSALNSLDDLIENTREWMSNFLDRLNNLKEIIDELLCHSMSTAQVATSEDDKDNILNRSQKILHGMETLKDDLAGDDMPSVILSAHTVSDALCALERAVNSAVLRLVLHINSGLEDPLRKLVDLSRPDFEYSESKCSKKASDLDEPIHKFDAHMDKLMQIGTFAVSCSSNINKAMQLRSCLASFESLEAELIPCVTAIYLDPRGNNKRNLRLFVDHWLKESDKFRSILDAIVDPAAFIDVVKDMLNQFSKNLEISSDVSSNLNSMIKVAKTLRGVLEMSIQQDCPDNVTEITVLAQKVYHCIDNCERLFRKIRNTEVHVPVNEISKRVQLLLESVDKVWDYLARKIVAADLSNLEAEPLLLLPPQQNYYKLCPSDCGTPPEPDLNLLTPHITKGSVLVKEAILYNTPKRSTVKRSVVKATPRISSTIQKNHLASVSRSRCFRSTCKAKQSESELSDMQLTALLEDLSKLDATFSLNETLKPRKEKNMQGRQLLALFTGWDSLLEESPDFDLTENRSGSNARPGSTIGSSDTPQRVQDLITVSDKIEQLKIMHQNN